MTRSDRKTQSKDEFSGSGDGTIEVTQSISKWVNKDVFTVKGNLKDDAKFSEEVTHLLTIEWPDHIRPAGAVSHWHADIKTSGPQQAIEFAASTAENIGMDNFEMVKMVMERCIRDFGAHLLEVTSHGVKLGHYDWKSAEEVKERKRKDVQDVLSCLMADTEYLFMDVVITWEVSITETRPGLSFSGSVASRQDSLLSLGQSNSLVIDGPTLTPSSARADPGNSFDWSKVAPVKILVRILARVSHMERKMDNFHADFNDRKHFPREAEGKARHQIDYFSFSDSNINDGPADDSACSLPPADHNSDTRHQLEEDTSHRSSLTLCKAMVSEHHKHSEAKYDERYKQHQTSTGQQTASERGSGEGVPQGNSGPSSFNGNIGERVGIKETSQKKNSEAATAKSSDTRSKDDPSSRNTGHDRSAQKSTDTSRQLGDHRSRQDTARTSRQTTSHSSRTPSHHEKPSRESSRESARDFPSSEKHSSQSSKKQEDEKTKSSFHQTSDKPGAPSRRHSSATISEMQMSIECGSDREAELVRESVNRAYQEDEFPPPKAKSFDTILCLDISDSMKEGGAFEEMKRTALAFIDGVEDVINDSGIEENMGLVTFGGRANVIQNLTNDFSRIRDGIENMKPGGKSPFVEALLVAMAAFVRKGGIVSVSGEWEVRPRIIFISDGYPTESTEDAGNDTVNISANLRMSLSRMLISFKSSESFNKVHPVIFIPAGTRADKKYMQVMSKLCDGEYLEPQNVLQLCHYFRVQETIGKVLVCLKREAKNTTPERLKATVDALTPELTDGEKQKVLEVVKKELDNPDRARTQRTKPNDLDYVFEDTEKVNKGERLPLGTRVIRGPDWEWDEQDKGGPGTVINHHKKHSWHWVHWDFGEYNCYPYSKRRGYHIWQAEDKPRLKQPDEPLDIGMTVQKGPDWNASEAEEGQGAGMGVVIRKSDSKGKIVVRWSGGVFQTCNWSVQGLKEVEYCDPFEEKRTAPQRGRSPPASAQDLKRSVSDCEHGLWQWRDADGSWQSYDPDLNQQLEAEYKKRPNTSCLVKRDGKQRRVMFRKLMEKVIDGGMECEVRRIPAK